MPHDSSTAATTRRLGMAVPTRLGVTPAGLVAEGHRGGLGRQPRRGLSVAQPAPGGRGGGAAHPTAARSGSALDGRAARPAACALGARGRSVRLPGRRVDGAAGGRRHLAHVWGALPSRLCWSPLAPDRLEPAAAGATPHPTRRGSHSAVVHRALASPSKKAREEGRTIVWVDESAFYLLPHAVRTWAPRRQTPILRMKLSHDHLAAISGITLDGRLCFQLRASRPLPLRAWWASCACCSARCLASSWSSGMARRSTSPHSARSIGGFVEFFVGRSQECEHLLVDGL